MKKTDGLSFGRRNFFRSGAIVAAAAFSGHHSFATPVTAAETASATDLQGAGFYRFKIGDFKAIVISDGHGTLPFWPTLAANQSEAAVLPVLEANYLKPINQFTCNMLVVDTGREKILVDTGFGEVLGPKFGQFSDLKANLLRAGIPPESIDVVLTTHGHIDHIAGIVSKDGSLAFPNARYAFAEKEWAYWTGDRFEADTNGAPMSDVLKQGTIWAAKTSLPPIRDKVQLVKPDGEVAHGVHLIAAPGHSYAHSAVLFASGGDQLIHLGDVANVVMGLQRPDWSTVFDYDSERAIKTRKSLLDRVATDRTLAMGYHYPFPAVGHIEKFNGAYRWYAAEWTW
jgi:glyoxylase-like metal-dependent hydrolase (beta-lactamase superfamily II)